MIAFKVKAKTKKAAKMLIFIIELFLKQMYVKILLMFRLKLEYFKKFGLKVSLNQLFYFNLESHKNDQLIF